ncbi:hypothetical protein EVAR_84088_1 [Eumeta japonica]|uniref:Uncharacterized protein n=1 Tax=Eumeta variegata TaxID=151549 RepID=A0A4C1V0B2_EUMVA|nr:hypothetical protein EVAR_84088_1 [Eumeta japonica]
MPSKPLQNGARLPSGPDQQLCDTLAGSVEESASTMKKDANRALADVHYCGVINKLRFAPLKTNSLVITKKLEYDDQAVHINGEEISLSQCAVRLVRLDTGNEATRCAVAFKACRAHRMVLLHCALIISTSEWEEWPGCKSVEELDSHTMDRLAIVGTYIYTDGTRKAKSGRPW